MACFSYDKLRQPKFYKFVSAKDKVQDINLNHLKLKLNDTYKKDEKVTTKFEATNPEDVKNKGFFHKKSSKIKSHNPCIVNDYNEFKLHYNKQSVEEISIQRAEKTNEKVLFDKCLFDAFPLLIKFKKI